MNEVNRKVYMREYMAKKRAEKKGLVEGVEVPKVSGQDRSITDNAFAADRPGWYIFSNQLWERECWKCGEKFQTQLEMNKFCSPKCKNEWLDAASVKRLHEA